MDVAHQGEMSLGLFLSHLSRFDREFDDIREILRGDVFMRNILAEWGKNDHHQSNDQSGDESLKIVHPSLIEVSLFIQKRKHIDRNGDRGIKQGVGGVLF